MAENILDKFEKEQLKEHPEFRTGDTVVVQVKVTEGKRTRLQAFEGLVISKKNRGLNSSFIVRKISSGVGVERTFQTHSPLIDSIKVKRKGLVRQSKIYYIRERSGKSARIKEKINQCLLIQNFLLKASQIQFGSKKTYHRTLFTLTEMT